MNSLQESAWLAGLLEGEAWFGASKEGKDRQRLRVGLEMIDQDVVERAYNIVGDQNVSVTKSIRKNAPTWKPIYRVQWSGVTAENIMRRVLPYMGQRRKAKIEECLSSTDLSHLDQKVTYDL